MEENISWDKMCRSCLEKKGCISIFTKDDETQLSEMLLACASIEVAENQEGPNELCANCVMRLKESFLFREQCRRSDARLQDLQSNAEIKHETLDIVNSPGWQNDEIGGDHQNGEMYEDDLPLKDLKAFQFTVVDKGDTKKEQKLSKKQSPTKRKRNMDTENMQGKITKKIRKLEKLSANKNGTRIKLNKKPHRKKREEDKDILFEENFVIKVEDVIDNNIIKEESLNIVNDIENKPQEKNIGELYYGSDVEEIKMPPKKRTPKPKGQYICDQCGHCVSVKWDLITHFMRHTTERPFKCEICGKDFALERALKTHQKQHSGVKGFICDVCGKGLSTKETLLAHRRLHTGELPFTCSTCGKAFRALTNLRSHRKIHTGDKRHPCPVCAKLFYTKSDMRDHARRHTGERPFACALCPQRFTGRSNHRLHMKIHAGQKDFQCPHCPKTFVSRDSMRRHGRTHSGERAFKCEECGRRFAHRSSLVSHKAIHSKTKDYVCDICSQRFGYPSGLYVHRKKKHNIQSSRIVAPLS